MEIVGGSKIWTNVDYIRSIVSGLDCILAFETAADFLGINNGFADQRLSLYVYALTDLGVEGVDCTVVESFDNIDFVEDEGVKCTSVTQTIFDLLRYDRDDQVILETLADWYFSHNESFDGLNVPDDLQGIFDDYKEDAIHYYDC